jgi:hypothetical protein
MNPPHSSQNPQPDEEKQMNQLSALIVWNLARLFGGAKFAGAILALLMAPFASPEIIGGSHGKLIGDGSGGASQSIMAMIAGINLPISALNFVPADDGLDAVVANSGSDCLPSGSGRAIQSQTACFEGPDEVIKPLAKPIVEAPEPSQMLLLGAAFVAFPVTGRRLFAHRRQARSKTGRALHSPGRRKATLSR